MTKRRMLSAGAAMVSAAGLGLVLAACGSGQVSGSAVTGVALTDVPISGTVSLNDSSAQVRSRTVSTRADGTFSIDVADLTPPYLIKVEWAEAGAARRIYAVSEGNDNLDVNPITDVAYGGAADGDEEQVFRESDARGKRDTALRARDLLARLADVLAPLLERYGITDVRRDKAAVRELLRDVRITRDDGVVTVSNKATGGIIFEGPLSDLASGTFHPENMPDGPGTTTPPPTLDGAALYTANCASCHGPLGSSNVRGESARDIAGAIAENEGGMGALAGLTSAELAAIADALSGTTTPGSCTAFTYSAWGDCVNGSQTRTVLSASPAGCTGGSPVTTQACTSGPPVLDGAALYQQYCAGCHGSSKLGSSASSIQRAIDNNTGGMGSAALRALTPEQVAAIAAAGTSTPATCTAFTYSTWGACQPDGTQTRTVLSSSPSGCTGGSPVTTQACTYVPPVTTCTAFTYSSWGACQPNGTQTRSVLTSSPSGCTGGSPVTTQACTYTPPIDGSALYTQYCAGCHGNSKKGSSASSIQRAINNNTGGMGSAALRALTAEQIAAIAAAP